MNLYVKCGLFGVCLGLGCIIAILPLKSILDMINDIEIYKAESQHYKTEIQNIFDVDLSEMNNDTIDYETLLDKVNEYHTQRVFVMELVMNNLKDSKLKDYDININQIIKSYMV